MVNDVNGESTIAYLNEGNQLKEAGFYDRALECYAKALAINPENSEIHNQHAEVYCLQGKAEEAIACCHKALTIQPNYAVAYKTLGNAFLAGGKLEEARESYAKAVEIQPDYAAALANLGSIYAQEQNWQQAIFYYQKAIAIQPNFAGFYRNLARVFSQIGKPQEAAECGYLGLILEPDKATAEEFLDLGNTLVEQGKQERAVICYRLAIVASPIIYEAHYKLGNNLAADRQWDEAELCYRKTVELNPNWADAYLSLGQTLEAQGKWEDAIACYSKAIDLNPESALFHYNLGEALAKKWQWDRAISAYQKTIQLDPNYFEAHQRLGEAFHAVGKLEDAIAFSPQSLAIRSNKGELSTELNTNLFEAQEKSGDDFQAQEKFSEALSCYRQAFEINPDRTTVHHRLWVALANAQTWDDAVVWYRRAIEIRPNFAWLYHHLGLALDFVQKWEEAVASYRRAIELDPNSCWSHQLLGQALEKQGCFEEAIVAYQQAVQTKPDYAEAYYNLAWLFSQQNQWDEAILCYQKACDIKPFVATEINFHSPNKYTFINLYSLSEYDRIFLENVGISLAHLELIEQNNATWKKMYSEDWRYLSQFMPEFQERILETGYINSFCPISGKVVKSNQSFYLALDYNITLYRFSGVDVFYLIVGCSHTLTLGIYVPSRELIISFCDPRYSFLASSRDRFEYWINTFKSYTISCLNKVKHYISNDEPKPVTAALGFLPNIGHYFMNELSAFQELYDQHLLNGLNNFLIGPHNYFDIREVFPELAQENPLLSVFQVKQKPGSYWAFSTCLTYNLFALTLTNFRIQEKLAHRLYHCSLKKCQESFIQKVGESKKHFPIIWITLRSHRRSWLKQIEGIANIINELFKDYHNLAIIFDGMSSENKHFDKIKTMLPPMVKTYNALDCDIHETIVWVHAIDTFICPWGAGSIFTSIANKPGVFHANTEQCRPEPFYINPRENCVLASSVPVDSVVDYLDSSNNPSDRNYDCNWKSIYAESIKIIELLKDN